MIGALGYGPVRLSTSTARQSRCSASSDGVAQPERRTFSRIQVVIDRPKGFVQEGKARDGTPWKRTYTVDYGFIPETVGGDGEALDVFIGPNEEATSVWWAEQISDDGKRDELKLLFGFDTADAARKCFTDHIPERYLKELREGRIEEVLALVGVKPWARANALGYGPVSIAGLRIAALMAPNQPRDDHGRWSDGHGAVGAVGTAARSAAQDRREHAERGRAAKARERAESAERNAKAGEEHAEALRRHANEARDRADAIDDELVKRIGAEDNAPEEATEADGRELHRATIAAKRAAKKENAVAERAEERAVDATDAAHIGRREADYATARADALDEHARVLGLPGAEYHAKATERSLEAKDAFDAAEAAEKAARQRVDAAEERSQAAWTESLGDDSPAAKKNLREAHGREEQAKAVHEKAIATKDVAEFRRDFWRDVALDAADLVADRYVESDDDAAELSTATHHRNLAKLSDPKPTVSDIGPAVSAQLYIDRVVDEGIGAAPGALRDTLSAVIGAIESAKSYTEVQQRLVELAPGASQRSADFATLLEGAIMVGLGAGQWAVGEETNAS